MTEPQQQGPAASLGGRKVLVDHDEYQQIRVLAAKAQQLFSMTAPVGVTFLVSEARVAVTGPDGELRSGLMVELWVCDASGAHVAYLDGDQADGLADQLREYARRARSGLVALSGADAAAALFGLDKAPRNGGPG